MKLIPIQQNSTDESGFRRRRAADAMCAFYLAGKCTYGDECKFSHSTAVGDTSRIPQCKFWLQGTCRHGPRCMFSHNTNAPIARKNTVSTEEQIENLTQNMLNGTTAARVLPNGVLQYYTTNDSENKTSLPAPMYCYPIPQSSYLASSQQAMVTPFAGMNYLTLPNAGMILQPAAPSLQQTALTKRTAYTTAGISQPPAAPSPDNNTLLKRKLTEANSQANSKSDDQARKKIRRDESVSDSSPTANKPKQDAVIGESSSVPAYKATTQPMLVVPFKPGRPLINAAQPVAVHPSVHYAQQAIAPAPYMTFGGQSQLLTSQPIIQQTALQIQYPPPVITQITTQSSIAGRPLGL